MFLVATFFFRLFSRVRPVGGQVLSFIHGNGIRLCFTLLRGDGLYFR